MSKTPKILLVSHAAWRGTGYGAPVRPLIALWRKLGYDAVVLAVEEHGPAMVEWGGIRHYTPHPSDGFGMNLLPVIAQREGVDAIVSLLDVWTLPMEGPAGYSGLKLPWLAWFPVDHTPPEESLVARARKCDIPASFSDWGTRQLREHGVTHARTIPYGIDLDTFSPTGPAAALEPLVHDDSKPWPQRPFIVGTVGTNLARDRKGLETAMKGFVLYAQKNPLARMFMWTNPDGDGPAAKDLRLLRSMLGADEIIRFPTHGRYYFENTPAHIAELYRAFDLLLQPSAAEGFGIPVVEALACGKPVVAADNSSLTELVPGECGELMPTYPELGFPGGWWRRTSPAQVADKLERMHTRLTKLQRPGEIAQACRAQASKYSWKATEPLWDAALKELIS